MCSYSCMIFTQCKSTILPDLLSCKLRHSLCHERIYTKHSQLVIYVVIRIYHSYSVLFIIMHLIILHMPNYIDIATAGMKPNEACSDQEHIGKHPSLEGTQAYRIDLYASSYGEVIKSGVCAPLSQLPSYSYKDFSGNQSSRVIELQVAIANIAMQLANQLQSYY